MRDDTGRRWWPTWVMRLTICRNRFGESPFPGGCRFRPVEENFGAADAGQGGVVATTAAAVVAP
jgi:hypothetical protein